MFRTGLSGRRISTLHTGRGRRRETTGFREPQKAFTPAYEVIIAGTILNMARQQQNLFKP
jgi:hypothetical protein